MARQPIRVSIVVSVVLLGAVFVWHRATTPKENERTAMARLTLLLPGLDPAANSVASTYVCDDDAVKPCHASSRKWSVSDRSLTLDQLALDLAPWALINHLGLHHGSGSPWTCASNSDLKADIGCVTGLSTGQDHLRVEVHVDLAGPGGREASMDDGVARAGTKQATRLTVRTVVYPSENGDR